MSKILAVFGATGQQGGSVIHHVFNDPELSKIYKIRAVTRDVNSEKSKALKAKGAEVVEASFTDKAALQKALVGVNTVFAMTAPALGPEDFQQQYDSAKLVADTAVERGVSYLIFSTLPSINDLSGGKYTKVSAFDAKAESEKYIRTLKIKSSFVSLGFFFQNFQQQAFLAPKKAEDGTWVFSRPNSSQTKWPLLDAVADNGKFVGTILAEPEKYEGKVLTAAQAFYSLDEICAILSKTTGEKIVYKQIPVDEFKKMLPFWVDIFVELFSSIEENGYFGPTGEESASWAAAQVKEKLTTMEEYFTAHPLQL